LLFNCSAKVNCHTSHHLYVIFLKNFNR
jgi:hypothetical protein